MDFQPRSKKGEPKKPRKYSIKEFKLSDGTEIGVFEGERGNNPDHDILIKYKEDVKRVRTPKHIHWVVDMIIKKEHNKELTLKFMQFLRAMYDKVDSFKTKDERDKCELKESTEANLKPFEKLNEYGEYKIDFIAHLIELMIRMEKNMPEDNPARVFKELIDTMIEEKDIFAIVSKATQTGH